MPLHGIKVIDFTQGICGPYAGLLMADAGAQVTKVEPVTGDYAREFGPPWIGEDSAVFLALNRNKQSVCLDGGSKEGQEILVRLISSADVFVTDLPAADLERLGLGYESLEGDNPGLIYCLISAFGDKGPLAGRPGTELAVQAMSGCASSLSRPDEGPVRVGPDIASTSTGVMAFSGVLAALFSRFQTGEGQKLDVSMYGTLLQIREVFSAAISDPDEWVGFHTNSEVRPKQHGYETKDGRLYFNFHRGDQEDFDSLLIALGMEESVIDPRFSEGGRHAVGLGEFSKDVKGVWEKAFRAMTTEQVVETFAGWNGSASAVNDYRAVIDHPQVKGLPAVGEIAHPVAGSTPVLRPLANVVRNSEMVAPGTPAALGQHNVETLKAIGYTDEEVDNLDRSGVIRSAG